MTRHVLAWLASLVIVAAAMVLLMWEVIGGKLRPQGFATSNTGLTVEQIQMLSALTVLKIETADAVVTDLRGYLGDMRTVLVVHGEVQLGVDLSAARVTVDQDAKTATLELPEPQVQSVRIDHERTRLVDIRTGGLWMIVPGGSEVEAAVVSRAYREAERIVGCVAEDPAMIARARQQAEQVLLAFLHAMGWQANINWRE